MILVYGYFDIQINKETESDRSPRYRSGDSAEFHYKETLYKFRYTRLPKAVRTDYNIPSDLMQADSP